MLVIAHDPNPGRAAAFLVRQKGLHKRQKPSERACDAGHAAFGARVPRYFCITEPGFMSLFDGAFGGSVHLQSPHPAGVMPFPDT